MVRDEISLMQCTTVRYDNVEIFRMSAVCLHAADCLLFAKLAHCTFSQNVSCLFDFLLLAILDLLTYYCYLANLLQIAIKLLDFMQILSKITMKIV